MIHPSFKNADLAWLRTGSDPATLAAIHEPGVELALWRRTLEPGLAWWLACLPYGQLPDGRVLCSLADLRPAVGALLSPTGPLGPMQDLLLDDIAALARIFVKVNGCDLVDLRLDRLDDDGCAAFHRDCVDLRLLTTYRGPGSEWVEPRHADRALARQQRYDGPVERLQDHAVALMRGSTAPGAYGLVHRSPPIHGEGSTRLLLCLNTASAASPERWMPPAPLARSPVSESSNPR